MTSPGQVKLYFRFTDDLTDQDILEASEVLSPEERAKSARFVFRQDRRDYVVAHALVRLALSSQRRLPPSSWAFGSTAYGKPILAPGQAICSFNITHTAGFAACALSLAGAIGVDAESIRQATSLDRIAARYFARAEVEALHNFEGDERQTRFVELWTLKEAYLKAIGTGLSTPMETFAFEMSGGSGLRFTAPDGARECSWQFALFAPSELYRMAVAVRSEIETVYLTHSWRSGFELSPLRLLRTTPRTPIVPR
jgi:4'-phosphopantetheinyl transferase